MNDSLKYQKWCKLFLDPKSETVGNASQSALKVYKVKNYGSASSIGYQNFRKLQVTGLEFLESEGLTIREWFKIAAAKAVKGSYEQTIDFMQRIGIIPKDSQGPTNQFNQQFNFADLAETFRKARIERGLPVD